MTCWILSNPWSSLARLRSMPLLKTLIHGNEGDGESFKFIGPDFLLVFNEGLQHLWDVGHHLRLDLFELDETDAVLDHEGVGLGLDLVFVPLHPVHIVEGGVGGRHPVVGVLGLGDFFAFKELAHKIIHLP